MPRILLLFTVIMVFSFSGNVCWTKNIQAISHRPYENEHGFDFSGVVPSEVIREINNQAIGLKKKFDIDFVVVVLSSLEGKNVNEVAVDLFSQWQIGRDTQGKKGLLILLAVKEQQIKIEVGYDLEEIYTDMYVGRVEREILKEFLEQADWKRGFLATIENFVERAGCFYEKGVNIKSIASSGSRGFYSGGAGAENMFDFGAALKKSVPQTPKKVRSYFGAQSTPQLAFERYMEFCAHNISDYTVDLFSDLSKQFFKNWKTASAQRRSEAEQCNGRSYFIKVKDNHAAAIFPDKDIEVMNRYAPYFLIKTAEGWQMDINTMARVLSYDPGNYVHWSIPMHAYAELFMEEYNIDQRRYMLVYRANTPELPDAFEIFKKCLKVPRLWLGVYIAMATEYEQQFAQGYCAILEVCPGSPADKAGLKAGDIIVGLNNKESDVYPQDLVSLIKQLKPGDKVNMKILRNLNDMKRIIIKTEETDRKGYF